MISKRINILHCVGYMKKAGAETFIMNMYRRIDLNEFSFHFLCCENKVGDFDDEIIQKGGTIDYVNINCNSRVKILKYIHRICEYKKSFDSYDQNTIVHIHGHHSFDILIIAIAARLSGKRILIHSHNSSAEAHLFLHSISRLILPYFADKRVACSNMAGEWMYGRHSFTVIQNGIEVDNFIFAKDQRLSMRKELDIDGRYVIGHVGRFEAQKNHEFLIDVFNEFHKVNPDSVLLLIGDGELVNHIKEKVKCYDIQKSVLFLGIRKDVAKLYNAMDTFIFPSKYEGLGIVAIEAEASDLPCLFSDTLPMDINLTDKVIRCSIDDGINEWVKKLQVCKTISDKEHRRNNASLISEKGFSINECCKRLSRMYHEISAGVRNY